MPISGDARRGAGDRDRCMELEYSPPVELPLILCTMPTSLESGLPPCAPNVPPPPRALTRRRKSSTSFSSSLRLSSRAVRALVSCAWRPRSLEFSSSAETRSASALVLAWDSRSALARSRRISSSRCASVSWSTCFVFSSEARDESASCSSAPRRRWTCSPSARPRASIWSLRRSSALLSSSWRPDSSSSARARFATARRLCTSVSSSS
mmetsp:Transcript_30/g.89  ORF Transcript_30/g.89 Transcript_30/m.89 type:complete len:209 (+) Transcript_30:495-1121(+)